jgi:hypothetical protein
MFFDTRKISQLLNIDDIGIIEINLDNDDKWNCYDDKIINHKRNTTAIYWKNLSNEERIDRLKNHGMSGKKHSKKTRDKMSKSSVGKNRPTLHKSGRLIKDDKIVEFSCLSHFCKEYKLSVGHVSELLQGKRKSVKGWKNVI